MTTEAHGVGGGGTQSDTRLGGSIIEVDAEVILTAITKHSSCTATHGYLYDDNSGSPTLIEKVAFSGDVATFVTPRTLSLGVLYHVVGDKEGASYTFYFWSAPTYPIDTGYINWDDGSLSLSGASANAPYNIASVTFTVPTNITITPSALTMTGTASADIPEVDSLSSALTSTLSQQTETHEITRFPSVLSLTTGDPEEIFIVEAPISSISSTISTNAPIPEVSILPESVDAVLTVDGDAHAVNPSGTISIGSGGIGTRIIERDYPYVEGLIAGTTYYSVKEKWPGE